MKSIFFNILAIIFTLFLYFISLILFAYIDNPYNGLLLIFLSGWFGSTLISYVTGRAKMNKLESSDLKITELKPHGVGGFFNGTNYRVRVEHTPTNTVVECQLSRSIFKNRDFCINAIKKLLGYSEGSDD